MAKRIMLNCNHDSTQFFENLSELERGILTGLTATLIPLIMVSNGLLIFLLFKTKQMSKVFNLFILALSISDACIGSLLLPPTIFFLDHPEKTNNCTTQAGLTFFTTFLSYLSALISFSIAMDRCIHIHRPLKYKTLMTKTRAKLVTVLCLIVASGLAVPTALPIFGHSHSHSIVYVLNIVLFLPIFTIAIVGYVLTYCKVRNSVRSNIIWREQAAAGNSSQPKYLSHMFKTTMFILIFLCLCYLPYFIYNLVIFIQNQTRQQNFGSSNSKIDIFWLQTFVLITNVNSVANSCVILWRNTPMRRFLFRGCTKET